MLGAIIGDICGSTYEFNPVSSKNSISLFNKNSKFTDDTVLTVAIADALLKSINYKESLIQYTHAYPKGMGYGKRFFRWIFSKEHKPYNSYGNGSAMRVSAIGFYFNSIEEVLEEAKKSAEISHNHPEGIKGAQAVALAIYLARTGYTKQEIRRELELRFHYNFDYTVDEVSAYNHHNETCQKSVPEAIVAFFESTDFESAIINAIWLRGDADTQACIAGAIAEAYYKKIPDLLRAKAYKLLPTEPTDFIAVIEKFYQVQENILHDTLKNSSLKIKQGNLILENADFIVNASNTKLMLGSGVSHAFKQHCGGNTFQNYLFELIEGRDLVKGDVVLSNSGSATNFKYSLHAAVMNYSDKKKDMYPTYEDIAKILQNIIQIVEDIAYTENISTPKVVIPLFGCGTGKLNKLDVFHLIKEAFMHSKIDLELVIYVYTNEDLLLLRHDAVIIDK